MKFIINRGILDGVTGLLDSDTIIEIPEGITAISHYVFENCTSITEVIIPNGVTSIGKDAFKGCKKLQKVTFPSTLSDIGEHAFYKSGIKRFESWEGLETIGKEAFKNTGLDTVIFHEGVKTIGKEAFSRLSKLKTLKMPLVLPTIEENAFFGCKKIKSFMLGDMELASLNPRYDEEIERNAQIKMVLEKQYTVTEVKTGPNSWENYNVRTFQLKYPTIRLLYKGGYTDEAFIAGFKSEFAKVFKSAIDDNDVDFINLIIAEGKLLNNRNINSLIQHAETNGAAETASVLKQFKQDKGLK